jgi:hypothetical protein
VNNILRAGATIGSQYSCVGGIAPAAVTTQRNPTFVREPRSFTAAANDHLHAPCAAGAEPLSLDTMDEYAAELAEVGRMLREGAFRGGSVMDGRSDTDEISSTLVSTPLVSCRSHNVKRRR